MGKQAVSIKPLPGSRAPLAQGMADYIISLKQEASEVREPAGRQEIVERGVARTAEFQRKLQQYLEMWRLEHEVAGIGEPTAFPLVTLTCTASVADRIKSLPEVEAVFQDTADIGFIP